MENRSMAPIEDKLRALRAESEKLSAKSDALNKAIEHIESQLAPIGIAGWLDFDERLVLSPTRDGGEISGWLLGYTKLGNRWRLAARAADAVVDRDGVLHVQTTDAPMALADAPRIVRIQAADLFEDLLDHLTDLAREYGASVDKAIAAAKK